MNMKHTKRLLALLLCLCMAAISGNRQPVLFSGLFACYCGNGGIAKLSYVLRGKRGV